MMIIQWVVETAIVVISAHARFISAMPILLLGCVFTCYGPSAFYLAEVELKKGFGRSSLKTSAIASNVVIVGVREAPCTTGRSSKGQLQRQRAM